VSCIKLSCCLAGARTSGKLSVNSGSRAYKEYGWMKIIQTRRGKNGVVRRIPFWLGQFIGRGRESDLVPHRVNSNILIPRGTYKEGSQRSPRTPWHL
jgi:hypothetical protein